jgi:hypothetical protein
VRSASRSLLFILCDLYGATHPPNELVFSAETLFQGVEQAIERGIAALKALIPCVLAEAAMIQEDVLVAPRIQGVAHGDQVETAGAQGPIIHALPGETVGAPEHVAGR